MQRAAVQTSGDDSSYLGAPAYGIAAVANYRPLSPSPFFSKFGLHSKIQFKNSASFTRRVTGETDEISLAHFTKDGYINRIYFQVNGLLIERRVRVNFNLTPYSTLYRYFWSRVKDANNIP